MLFPSKEVYVKRHRSYNLFNNTEAMICFTLFSIHFSIVPMAKLTIVPMAAIDTIVSMAAIWYSRPILIKWNSKFQTNYSTKFKTNLKMLYPKISILKIVIPRVGGYMWKTAKL